MSIIFVISEVTSLHLGHWPVFISKVSAGSFCLKPKSTSHCVMSVSLYIFKGWGLAVFRPKAADRWSGCSLFSFLSASASCWSSSMITVHMLATTEEVAFGCWLHGVGLVVKSLRQTISGYVVIVWWSFLHVVTPKMEPSVTSGHRTAVKLTGFRRHRQQL